MNDRFHLQPVRVFCWLCCFCACLWACLSVASASDFLTEPQDTSTVVSTEFYSDGELDPESNDSVILVEITNPQEIQSFRDTEQDTQNLTLTDVQTTITRVSAEDTTGFKAIILGLIGDYEMVTKEYTYTGNNGYTSKQVTTESDYSWMISAGIFIIVVYCFLRILGGVICGRK